MAELVFIATVVFVAYVVFVVLGKTEQTPEASKPEPSKPVAAPPVVNEAATPEVSAPPAKPATTPAKKPAAKKTTTPAKTAPAAAAAVGDSIKNPATGEVAKIPASYSFAKRWIKDALVEEGLLDKVYKNNELNDETNAKIQTALSALKAMDKYQ